MNINLISSGFPSFLGNNILKIDKSDSFLQIKNEDDLNNKASINETGDTTDNAYDSLEKANDMFSLKVGVLKSLESIEEIFKGLGDITNLNTYKYSDIDKLGRFTDVKCPEETRFRGNPKNPKFYSLHANIVSFDTKPTNDRDFNGKLILSQYPMLHQFNHFWRALKYSPLVLDLTTLSDKVDPYYSCDIGRSVQLKNVSITCCYKKSIGDGLEEFTYIVRDQKYNNEYLVHRLHFKKWIDRDVLNLKDLTMLVEKCYDHETFNPNTKNHFCGAVIHCMAGVGRSGTFAVAYALYDMIQKGLISKSTEEGELKQILCELVLSVRMQRGPYCIQTAGQLKTIWNWLNNILERDV